MARAGRDRIAEAMELAGLQARLRTAGGGQRAIGAGLQQSIAPLLQGLAGQLQRGKFFEQQQGFREESAAAEREAAKEEASVNKAYKEALAEESRQRAKKTGVEAGAAADEAAIAKAIREGLEGGDTAGLTPEQVPKKYLAPMARAQFEARAKAEEKRMDYMRKKMEQLISRKIHLATRRR
jgi:hypothetical protein